MSKKNPEARKTLAIIVADRLGRIALVQSAKAGEVMRCAPPQGEISSFEKPVIIKAMNRILLDECRIASATYVRNLFDQVAKPETHPEQPKHYQWIFARTTGVGGSATDPTVNGMCWVNHEEYPVFIPSSVKRSMVVRAVRESGVFREALQYSRRPGTLVGI